MAKRSEDTPAQKLADRYGGYWSEHPEWPVDDWKHDVANGDDRRGYWEWVLSNIEHDHT